MSGGPSITIENGWPGIVPRTSRAPRQSGLSAVTSLKHVAARKLALTASRGQRSALVRAPVVGRRQPFSYQPIDQVFPGPRVNEPRRSPTSCSSQAPDPPKVRRVK